MKTVLFLIAVTVILVTFKPGPEPEPEIGQIHRECLEVKHASLCTIYIYTENGWVAQPRGLDHLTYPWSMKIQTKKWLTELTEL